MHAHPNCPTQDQGGSEREHQPSTSARARAQVGAPERMKRASSRPVRLALSSAASAPQEANVLLRRVRSEGAVGGARKCTERERARAVGVYDMGKVGHARKHRSAGSLGIGLT